MLNPFKPVKFEKELLNQKDIQNLVNIFKQYGKVEITDNAVIADFPYTRGIVIETAPSNGNDKMQLLLGDDKRVHTEYVCYEQLMYTIDHIFDTKRFHETQEALDLDAEEYHIENERLEREGAKLDAKLKAQGIDIDNLTLDEKFEYGYFSL